MTPAPEKIITMLVAVKFPIGGNFGLKAGAERDYPLSTT
jgi:hypothetical protein